MFKSPEYVSNIRTIAMGLTGIICLGYATLVLVTGSPHPVSPWLPGVVGIGASIIIFIAFLTGGRRAAQIAKDELYTIQNNRALGIGFWIAMMLYPLFGLLIYLQTIPLVLALPAMGTLTAAGYLIPFAYLTGRNS